MGRRRGGVRESERAKEGGRGETEKERNNSKKEKEERWREHDRREAGNRVVSWRVEGAYKMRFPRAVPSSNFWSWRPLAAHPSARLDAFNYPWNIVNYSASEQVWARLEVRNTRIWLFLVQTRPFPTWFPRFTDPLIRWSTDPPTQRSTGFHLFCPHYLDRCAFHLPSHLPLLLLLRIHPLSVLLPLTLIFCKPLYIYRYLLL